MTRLAAAIAAVLIALAGITAPPASGDDLEDYIVDNAWQLCSYLNENPDEEAFDAILWLLLDAGFTRKEAAVILATSVYGLCPEFVPRLSDYANGGTRPI